MRSFSWTLALRYLNPLRAFVSVITLLSLVGVAFGVMVLIVVLSVHAGFERNLKQMLLGFSPHVVVQSAYRGQGISDWQEMEQGLVTEDRVEAAYALVEGYVLLDVQGWNSPVRFRGINTESSAQLDALRDMLDEGTIDLEPKVKSLNELEESEAADSSESEGGVVLSKLIADELMLKVGDQIRLLASSNLDTVIATYRIQENGPAYELYADQFEPFAKFMAEIFTKEGDFETASSDKTTEAYRLIQDFVPEEGGEAPPMRAAERRMVEELLTMLDSIVKQEDGKDYFEAGTQEMIHAKLTELRQIDLEKADLESMNEIRDFVLPKELTVTGIYHDAQRARGPEVFLSLEIGQELRGLNDVSVVESIGLRTEDPYQADEIAQNLQAKLGEEWLVFSWMRRHAEQFQLVKTEKVMMSFALSFITLLSAFSIMAVMYTMTVQKRQEIGVMKALGASPAQIVKVFVYQGLIVGIGGALLGLGLGLLAIRFRQHIVELMRSFGIDPFPPQFHGMSELPARVIPEYLVIICIMAVILCLLAALVPALLAAFRDPAKSLRNL